VECVFAALPAVGPACCNDAMSLFPPDDDLDRIHTRQYETRAYRTAEGEILVPGAVSDVRPAGLYVKDDPDLLQVYEMQIELRLALLSLETTAAGVLFETHMHEKCPLIEEDYEQLVTGRVVGGARVQPQDPGVVRA
jgi:hypothetical protein